MLRARATLMESIRAFFKKRSVLEVETPLLYPFTVTDPHLQVFESLFEGPGGDLTLYLQTSPEYAMKQLLTNGSGDIFQICKAFRNEESGSQHNPEFTLLEWYRLGFDHHDLMDEVAELIKTLLGAMPIEKYAYSDLISEHRNTHVPIQNLDDAGRQHYLMTHVIEPALPKDKMVFIYDYPIAQGALARANADGKTAARFEVYVNGVELANGYHELCDPKEQVVRFEQDNQQRIKMGLQTRVIDYRLLSAMEKGLPDCAGVAVGLDRLLMLQQNVKTLQDVLLFPINSFFDDPHD